MKKFMGLTMAAALAVSAVTFTAQANDKITVNGQEIEKTTITNPEGVKMIPLRAVCESLGFTVEWDNDNRMITISDMPLYITLTPDADGYTFARTAPMMLGTKPMLENGTTYVPVSFVSEIMQGKATEGEVLEITYGEKEEKESTAPTASVYITEKGENSITVEDFNLGTVIVNIDENTVITDTEGNSLKFEDLTEGVQLNVVYGDAMTLSLPPMTTAVKIEVTNEVANIIKEGKVTEVIKDGENIVQFVINDNEFILNVAAETILTGAETLADIKVGDSIRALTNGMATRSIPMQMPAVAITITEPAVEIK